MSRFRDNKWSTIPVSIVIGTLLVPLSAVAAVLLLDTPQAFPQTTEPPRLRTTAVAAEQPSLESDLLVACGDAGAGLADLEKTGQATDRQIAALDALRPICADAGMPLSGDTEQVPATRIVTLSASTQSSGSAQVRESEHDEDNDRDHEDHERGDDDEGHGSNSGHEDEHEAGD